MIKIANSSLSSNFFSAKPISANQNHSNFKLSEISQPKINQNQIWLKNKFTSKYGDNAAFKDDTQLENERSTASDKQIEECSKKDLFINKEQCSVSNLPWPTYISNKRKAFKIKAIYAIPDYNLVLDSDNIILQNSYIGDRILSWGVRGIIKEDVYCEIMSYKNLELISTNLFSSGQILTKDFSDVKIPDGCQYLQINQDSKNLSHFLGCFTGKSESNPINSFYLISHKISDRSNKIDDFKISYLDLEDKATKATISKAFDKIFFYRQTDDRFKILELKQQDVNSHNFDILYKGEFINQKDACRDSFELMPENTREISKSYKHSNVACVDSYDNILLGDSKIEKGPDSKWLNSIYSAIIIPGSFLMISGCLIYKLCSKKDQPFQLESRNPNNQIELSNINSTQNIQQETTSPIVISSAPSGNFNLNATLEINEQSPTRSPTNPNSEILEERAVHKLL